MAGARPMGIREVARQANRDVKAVHSDIQKLLKAGIIDKTQDGKIEFAAMIIVWSNKAACEF